MSTLRQTSGITLIEVLVVLAIVGILATMAAPNFADFFTRNRLQTQASELFTAMSYARSEAVRRGTSVTLCRSANGSSCAHAGGWEQGWIAFTDIDADENADAGEPLLRHWQALPVGYTMRGSVNVAQAVRFNARGMANARGHLVACRNNQIVNAQAVLVSMTRPRMAADANGNRIPEIEDANGNAMEITTCTP